VVPNGKAMANANPESNPLYARAEDLHPVHWENLARRPREETARAAGAQWDGETFALPLLGREVRVNPGARTVARGSAPSASVGYQRGLVALAYLAGAVEVPPRGEWRAFRELPGGDAFFRGPHSLATARLETAFGADPSLLLPAAERLGGREAEGAAVAADLPALPRIPLRVLLWGSTEEFPAAASLLVDARAHLHLPLDVLWALSNLAISDLVEGAR